MVPETSQRIGLNRRARVIITRDGGLLPLSSAVARKAKFRIANRVIEGNG